MNSDNLITVVIPTHNRANVIARAVDSVLNQTYNNIEIIVVSDGSEDNTDKVLEEIQKEDKRVRYISYHPGLGGNHARNVGVIESKSEWVAFLDDDDEWYPDKLSKQIDFANKRPDIGLICTGIESVYDVTNTSSFFIPDPPEDSSKEILIRNCIGSTTTCMIRRSVIEECGLFDENLKAKQDYDLWIRICQKTKIGVIREPLVKYHNSPDGNQISWNYKKYADATEYIDHKYETLRKEKLTEAEIRNGLAAGYFSTARKAMKTNNGKVAREYIIKSLKIKFSFDCFLCFFASFIPFSGVRKVKKIMNSFRK